VLAENEVKLLEENWKKIFPDFDNEEHHKYYHDLRHELFIKQDMIGKALKRDPVLLADMSRRYIANAEFCMSNPWKFDMGFYRTSSFLVSLAGAYFNIIDAGLHDDGVDHTANDVDSFILYLGMAADASAAADESVVNRIRNMCGKASGELDEHRVKGRRRFCSALRKIRDSLKTTLYRTKHPRAGEAYKGRKRGF
jgi:hypothetical protein